MDKTVLNILLFCNKPTYKSDASTIIDHINSFIYYSKHHIYLFSNTFLYPYQLDLNRFDVIVVHYSSCLLGSFYLSDQTKEDIKKFSGLKVIFVQDEYRRVYDTHKEIKDLGFHILYTCVPTAEIEKVYPSTVFHSLKKINTLTGYIPERLLVMKASLLKDRPIDVGYRARKLPFYLGSLGIEKYQIVDKFYKYTKNRKLIYDLSYKERKRLYGNKWIDFLSSCKAILGVESGASVFDFTGNIEKNVCRYLYRHPFVSFDKVHHLFLKDYEGKIYLNQISPRCFEAIALRTALILYEGNYSGILKPWQHYIPLKKDFSNINEVVNLIHSPDSLQRIVDRAYQEIGLSSDYTYKKFIQEFDKTINEVFFENKKVPIFSPYTEVDFLKRSNSFYLSQVIIKLFKQFVRKLFFIFPGIIQYFIKSIFLYFIDKKRI